MGGSGGITDPVSNGRERRGEERGRGEVVVEMERKADVKSDCRGENKGVKMRGGDGG